NWGRHGLGDDLGICARIISGHGNGWWRHFWILRNRQFHQSYGANYDDDDRKHRGENRSIYEEMGQHNVEPSLVCGDLFHLVFASTRHVNLIGLDLRTVAHPLNAIHDDPVVGPQSLGDYLHSIADDTQLDVSPFSDVFIVDHIHKLSVLIRANSALRDED